MATSSGETFSPLLTSLTSSSPEIGATGARRFLASARKAGSFIVAMKEVLSAATRSFGTSGATQKPMPISSQTSMNSIIFLPSSDFTRSPILGTSGSSGMRGPYWIKCLILPVLSQSFLIVVQPVQ